MSITIEDVPVGRGFTAAEREPFIRALKTLNVGQSFLLDKVTTDMRNIVGIATTLLDRSYAIRKESAGFRIGRTA